MKIPRAVPDRLQGAGEQSQKSKRQWKVGEWSDDIAAYLPDLPDLLQSPLLSSSASSSAASAHMPGRGKREGQYMDTYGDCEVRKKHGKLGATSILGVPPLDTAARDGAVRYGAATPSPMRCSPITS